MIKNTNADCKILTMTTTGTSTKIICAIFSTKPTPIAKAFQFYFKDLSGKLTLVSDKIYWIDRANAYNTSAININVLNYKEVSINIDITDSDNSVIVDKHWVRKGHLVLIDLDDASMTSAWSSQEITLISENFETPTLNYATITAINDKTNPDKMLLTTKFKLTFKSSKTLSYNFSNLSANIKLINISGQKIIEQIKLSGNNLNVVNEVSFMNSYQKNMPIILEIEITNQHNVPYLTYRKRYTPRKTTGKTYIRTADGIKTAIGWYIKNEIYSDKDKSDWLPSQYEDING